jgi:SpoVK/Ycf46/Vps4 family AAA+-type ATPase
MNMKKIIALILAFLMVIPLSAMDITQTFNGNNEENSRIDHESGNIEHYENQQNNSASSDLPISDWLVRLFNLGYAIYSNTANGIEPMQSTTNFTKLNREVHEAIKTLVAFYKNPQLYEFHGKKENLSFYETIRQTWEQWYQGIYSYKKPISGIVLYGDPGCGKTELMRALAGEGVPVFAFSGSEFRQPLIGQSEELLRNVYDGANKYRYGTFFQGQWIRWILNKPRHPLVVVFLDEIDSLGQQRGGFNSKHTDSFLNQLLTLLDGAVKYDSIVTIASTNRPDLLDSALTRSKRLGIKIEIKNPTKEEKLKIIKSKFDVIGLKRSKSLDDILRGEGLNDLGTSDCAELPDICHTISRTNNILNAESEKIDQEKPNQKLAKDNNVWYGDIISDPFYGMSCFNDEICEMLARKEQRKLDDQAYDPRKVLLAQAACRGYMARKICKGMKSEMMIGTKEFKQALEWMGKNEKESPSISHLYT